MSNADDVKWLHEFVNASVFEPPAEAIERAHEIIKRIADEKPASAKMHRLKTVQPYFDDILTGRKKFEIRKDDRGFRVGDFLMLQEWDGSDYTGFTLTVAVSYILDEFEGLAPGYVAMEISIVSLKRVAEST